MKTACFLALFLIAFNKPIEAQNLYVVEHDGLYGFGDKSGKIIIPPKYINVKPFSEGLATVYENGKWGFIDSNGRLVIGFEYQEVEDFSSGVAAVRKTKWGFIEKSGKELIPFRFIQAGRFSEGMAPVEDQSGWLFVDTAGTPMPGLAGFEDTKSFSEGLAPVQVDGKWRFITPKGTEGFRQEFSWASSFSEHLAAVQQEENGRYGFIDRSGNYVVRPTFNEAKPFAEGLAAVRLSGRWGYVTKSGEIKIPAIYPLFADDFVAGLATVSNPVDGAGMYINSDGQTQFLKNNETSRDRTRIGRLFHGQTEGFFLTVRRAPNEPSFMSKRRLVLWVSIPLQSIDG